MEEKIKKRLLKVFDNYELTLLIIFGSYNSDNFNKDSDIDLEVKVNDPEQIRENFMNWIKKSINDFLEGRKKNGRKKVNPPKIK